MAYGKTTEAIVGLDNVTKYIFHNYYNLLTENETLAWKVCVANAKGEASGNKDYARFLSDRFFNLRRKEIIALLSNGPESFFVGVRARLLKEQKDKIIFNYCPRCGALARTPQAKICPDCSFSWHSQMPESILKK